MADGNAKPIEQVETGDKVTATDPKTGETRAETVTAEITGEGTKRLVTITVDADGQPGGRTAEVTATEGHPFWVPDLNQWVDATDLQPGQWLRTSAGTHTQIAAIEHRTTRATVRNLTVANIYTYYVLAGHQALLNHNIDLCELNSGSTTSTTHWAHATVHDGNGNILHEFDIRSGNQTDAEKAMGRGGETLSHTENRVAGMTGGARSYGTKTVDGDEFFNETPVPEGGFVVIRGTRPPCSSCRGAMTRASEDTGATYAYFWEDDAGKVQWWQTDLPLSW